VKLISVVVNVAVFFFKALVVSFCDELDGVNRSLRFVDNLVYDRDVRLN
jgi:hypothetical protein